MVDYGSLTLTVIDGITIGFFYLILFGQSKTIRTSWNLGVALVSIPIIMYADYWWFSASIFLLALTYAGLFRVHQRPGIYTFMNYVRAMLANLVIVNIVGVLTQVIFKRAHLTTAAYNKLFVGVNTLLFALVLALGYALVRWISHRVRPCLARYIDDWTERVFLNLLSGLLLLFILLRQMFDWFGLMIEQWGLIIFWMAIIVTVGLLLVMAVVSTHLASVTREHQAQQLAANEHYVQQLEHSYEKLRAFKHDNQNLLVGLYAMAQKNDVTKIEQTLDQLIETDTSTVSDTRVDQIHDSAIHGLIVAKMMAAQQDRVDFDVETNMVIESLAAQAVTVSRLLGIFLDNAIEAAAESSDKKVNVALIEVDQTLEIIIENSYAANQPIALDRLATMGYSTKGDNRGVGLASASELLAQNDAIFAEFQVKPTRFTVILTIELNDAI
ncbi:sensor histidine kinase [Lacticaseibacillus saniviri]